MEERNERSGMMTRDEWMAWLEKSWDEAQARASTPDQGVMAERNRIVNLLLIQHEAAKDRHNYFKVAAELVQADIASDT